MYTIDQSSPYIVEIPDVLTSEECSILIHRIDEIGPEIASINTAAGTKIKTDVRNNERVILDDAELAEKFFDKAKSHAPSEMRNRKLVGANERLRFYRYKPGMKFAPHSDGSFVRNDEMSFNTYLVYLNEECEGGETRFFTKPEVTIAPRTGLGLIFQHPFVHEGAGVKYVARTDLMYRRIL